MDATLDYEQPDLSIFLGLSQPCDERPSSPHPSLEPPTQDNIKSKKKIRTDEREWIIQILQKLQYDPSNYDKSLLDYAARSLKETIKTERGVSRLQNNEILPSFEELSENACAKMSKLFEKKLEDLEDSKKRKHYKTQESWENPKTFTSQNVVFRWWDFLNYVKDSVAQKGKMIWSIAEYWKQTYDFFDTSVVTPIRVLLKQDIADCPECGGHTWRVIGYKRIQCNACKENKNPATLYLPAECKACQKMYGNYIVQRGCEYIDCYCKGLTMWCEKCNEPTMLLMYMSTDKVEHFPIPECRSRRCNKKYENDPYDIESQKKQMDIYYKKILN